MTSLAPQVSKMKEAGVDLVTTCMDTNGVVTLAKEMKKQQLNAIQYLPDAYDHTFIKTYGDLFEGSVVRTDFTQFELPEDQQPPGLKDYLTWIAKENVVAVRGLDERLAQRRSVRQRPQGGRSRLQPPEDDRRHQQDDRTTRRSGLLAGVNWTVAHTRATARSASSSRRSRTAST